MINHTKALTSHPMKTSLFFCEQGEEGGGQGRNPKISKVKKLATRYY